MAGIVSRPRYRHPDDWDGRRIISAFDGPASWTVGEEAWGTFIINIEPIQYPGEMGLVRWLRVHYDNGQTVELNCAKLCGIRFAAFEGEGDS